MKYIKRALVIIPDQVMSTFLIFGVVIVFWRGVVSLWNTPPSPLTVFIVLCIGIALGLIGACAPEYEKPKQDTKSDSVDK